MKREKAQCVKKIVLLLIASGMLLQCHSKGGQISDSEKFALEYPLVGEDNIFVYRTADEAADIISKGRDWDFKADYRQYLQYMLRV